MMEHGLWTEPLFQKTSFRLILILLIFGVFVYYNRQKNITWTAAWLSVKSWVFIAPLILIVAGLPKPWPFFFLTLASLTGMKTFYKMVGMYHRSWFVNISYLFIFILAWSAYNNMTRLYNLIPMAFIGALTIIPIIKHSYHNFVQYIALSSIGFFLTAWSFLHLTFFLKPEGGVYIVLYCYALSELNFGASRIVTRWKGRTKIFSKISHRFSLEGALASLMFTLLVGYLIRSCLPDRDLWVVTCLSLWLLGHLGDLFLSVIRKDLKIKDRGVFIIGRDDILNRMSKLLLFAPILYEYYVYLGILQR